jgi:hypothetical protein
MTRDEDVATRRKAAEDAAWTAVSPEAAAAQPRLKSLRHDDGDDLLAEVERHRKLTLPIDELWPPPPGIV